MSNVINLYLNIEVDILTAETTAEVINAVLELLLYQRNQIPFVYQTFKYYVNKWDDEEESRSEEESNARFISNFNIKRQRELALQTKKNISEMRELIKDVLKNKSTRSLRFLFGSTALTPIESYTIHIPSSEISTKHSYENHRMSQASLNQSLITLLTSEELYAIFSKNLCTTNLFLELEIFEESIVNLHSSLNNENSTILRVFPKDFSELPLRCKDVHLHLIVVKPAKLDDEDPKRFQCCGELQIFSSLSNLSIENDSEINLTINDTDSRTSFDPVWWEAETIVRGFKDKTIKGTNIWTK